jgi:hypothetical protein
MRPRSLRPSQGAGISVRATWVVRALGPLILLTPSGCAADQQAPTAGCDRAAPPAAEQPPIAGAIDVTVQRLAPGCGAVLVSSGIPLAPGMLTAARLSRVRLYVGGKEQSLYVEPLRTTHADGSLRGVLVQFNYPAHFGTPVPGQLVIRETRGTADIPKPVASRTSPTAVILPTNPDYLVSTELVGPTVTVASTSQVSSTFQKYEADFHKYADYHWNYAGAAWTENYYDRALIYYAWWIRSGNVEYWKRATALAVSYRRDYLEANDYNTSAHWAQIEGIALHYLLTGDEASRYAVGRVGDVFSMPYYTDNLGNLNAVMDNRIQARTLTAFLTAWRLDAPSQMGATWARLLPNALTDILSSQDPSGAYRFARRDNQCGHNKPFMVGMLNDALIQYYGLFSADARIPPAVQKAIDYMWTNDWDSAAQAFVYLDGPCPGDDGGPSADLNNLAVNGFGWIYQRTRDPAYRDKGDQVFAGGVTNAWLEGSKQFNQEYTSSFRYLAYRK